ncbi:hypothetical protein BDN72DRAFT_869127 [Pluteus cervinus]|uniref:Uncharacterized protein n=1 Tax=Pluteus cervinus TaxID=181527 RepID=A0ACD3B8Q2_9AGAR|nr:hypothetical protein BDN72DRAFT_869127 [Pluteus cervinus]
MFPYAHPFDSWREDATQGQAPSVFGALPYPSGFPTSDYFTYQFTEFQPDIFNCTVVGPQLQICYKVLTDEHNPGYTVLKDDKDKNTALIEWQTRPLVEIRSVLPKRPVGDWLPLSAAKISRTMELKGTTYTWAPQDKSVNLYSGSHATIACLAKIFRGQNQLTLEITPNVLELDILEGVVVSTLLIQCGRNID